jgi:hypothetical protein
MLSASAEQIGDAARMRDLVYSEERRTLHYEMNQAAMARTTRSRTSM